MKERFVGAEGRTHLVEVLREQRLVQNDVTLAEHLADHGELIEFSQGDTLIAQGASDNSALFILSGNAAVFVNNRQVATRGPRDCVGEMSVIDPAAPRSATLKANGPVLAFRVSATSFSDAGDRYPALWRAAARILSERLHQRERFHRPENPTPIMFVGSSAEGLEVAREIQAQLKHDKVIVRLWTSSVFGPSGIPIDDLLKQVNEGDFALFVFGPDDRVASRNEEYQAPRDNVVLEMGLFMGKIGRRRTFMLKEQKSDLKIPSDLLGITPITYVCRDGCTLSEQLAPAATELRRAIRDLGAI